MGWYFGSKNGNTTIVAFHYIYIIYKWLYVYIEKQSSTLLSVTKTVRFLGEKIDYEIYILLLK